MSPRVATPTRNLKILFPKTAQEWDYDKNNDLLPEKFTPFSNKKVYWKCLGDPSHGSWLARICDRTIRNTGCPICKVRRSTHKYNLAKKYPEISAQWDYERNGDLNPGDFSPYSNRFVFWLCDKGHSWQESIGNRTKKGYNCPYCSGHRASIENNLAKTYPDLIVEWDYDLNRNFKPENLTPFSGQAVWWKCLRDPSHGSWQATICNRTLNKTGCPECSRLRGSPNNNLAIQFPEVATEWDYEKNGILKPEEVAPFSNYKVWWKCNEEHSWIASISSRSRGSGCPICSRKGPSPENNIKVCLPGLISKWDFEKNGKLKPEDLSPFSSKEVFWLCEKGHSTKAPVFSKARGLGCNECPQIRVSKSYNIFTECFELVDEWDSKANGKLKPERVSPRTRTRVYWKCSRCGHKFKMGVGLRANGMGCPKCGFNPLVF